MTMPQNPGYPAFPPTYQQPQPAPAQAPALPWQQPQAPAPQPFLPQQQPPAQVPGYGPPVMGPPMQPPPGYAPQNHWQGADNAQLSPRTANIPLGNHLFEWVKLERSRTGSQKDYTFITLKIVQSDNPHAVNTECAFKQNMNPNGNGGPNIAFNALAKVVFPALGYNVANPAQKAQIDAFLSQRKLSAWLLELECTNTVEGRPVTGRQFTGQITPGTRNEKTPPGKEPFPFMSFTPYMPPILG